MTLERHSISSVLPNISKERLEELRSDIEANGQRIKGIVYEGKILDGWNRYLCTGEKFQYEEFKGQLHEAVSLVMSLNLTRRHLTDNQRMCVAAELAQILKLKKSGHNGTTPEHLRTNGNRVDIQVAKMMNTSTGSVGRASYLLKRSPEKFEKCKNGHSSVNKEYIHQKREEAGWMDSVAENVKFPDVYSNWIEVEKFLKTITKCGWGAVISIEKGMISAVVSRSDQSVKNGEFSLTRAVVTALYPKKNEIILQLKLEKGITV